MNVPVLETPRLIMRGFRAEDHSAWHAIMSDDETVRPVGYAAGLDEAEAWSDLCRLAGHWMLRGYGQWALEERESGELVGRAGLIHHVDWPGLEVGWLVRTDRRGRGYAPEAGGAAMRYAFDEVGAGHVISLIADDNASSRRVAEKLGERPYDRAVVRGEELTVFRIDR
jgi:RimJ/RimL family protein N-acetyltransferase